MDLNYLYHRQQVERMRADAAGSPPARAAHAALAERYEAAIANRRSEAEARASQPVPR